MNIYDIMSNYKKEPVCVAVVNLRGRIDRGRQNRGWMIVTGDRDSELTTISTYRKIFISQQMKKAN